MTMHYTPDEAEALVRALPSTGDWRLSLMSSMIDDGATLREIGECFNLTRERVRQILARAGIDKRNWFSGPAHTAWRAGKSAKLAQKQAKRDARKAKHAAIVADYLSTKSTIVTAKRMGYSQMGVVKICQKAGVLRPKSSPVPVENRQRMTDEWMRRKNVAAVDKIARNVRIVAMRSDGMKLREIGEHFGMSPQTVWLVLRRWK